MEEPGSEQKSTPDAGPAPDLGESLRQVGATGRAGFEAASDAAKALRILVAADLSLARSALGRALAYTGVAIAFGASSWMLLMAAATAVLHDVAGWSWTMSLGVCSGASLLITAFGIWRAIHYFEHTRMKATRRQLARLGIGELADFMPDAGSGRSARDADTPEEPVKKGLGVDVTPP